MRQLEELWLMNPIPQSIVLYGHRRMGTTSILRNTADRLGSQTRIAYINLCEIAAQSALDLLKRHDVAETHNGNWRISLTLVDRRSSNSSAAGFFRKMCCGIRGRSHPCQTHRLVSGEVNGCHSYWSAVNTMGYTEIIS